MPDLTAQAQAIQDAVLSLIIDGHVEHTLPRQELNYIAREKYRLWFAEKLYERVILPALHQAAQAQQEADIAVFMSKHNVPKGNCEDDEGTIVCGCEKLAASIRGEAAS